MVYLVLRVPCVARRYPLRVHRRTVYALKRCCTTNTPTAFEQTPLVLPKKVKKRKVKVDPMTPPPAPDSFPVYERKDFFRFELLHRSSKEGSRARVGRLHTPHGNVNTPGFVAVATNGALKAVDHDWGNQAGQELTFCNTYHLLLQPGPDVIKACGGLHKFVNRNRPIITDSGGFQVFSLAHGSVFDELNMKSRSNRHRSETSSVLKISEEGCLFRSYRDGRKVLLTPESSVQAQKAYGSDIIIPLDELHPYHIDSEALLRCVLRSHRWEARSLKEHLKDVRQQAMYAVIHGGVDPTLRKASCEYLTGLPFDGFAVGGALGKDRDELIEVLRVTMPHLPVDKPNHLLGIADEPSIWAGAALGVDTFDSCFPTRIARHGTLLTQQGPVYIRKQVHKEDLRPLEEGCECFTCKRHSRAYLHHLYRAFEPLSATLLSIHNIAYMNGLMARIRAKILRNEL